MSDNRNQHTVPQTYLKRFAYNDSQLYVFDKHTKKAFGPTNIRNVGANRDFYNVPEPDKNIHYDPQIVDKILQTTENNFGAVLDEIAESMTTKIAKNQKLHLAFHLAILVLRTPEFRSSYIELSKKVLKDISEAYLKSQDVEARVEISVKFEAVAHAQMMLGSPLLAQLTSFFSDCIWAFYVNETEQPFYTSDNPIVKKNHLPSKLQLGNGWLSPGVEITFPISPNIILCMYGRKLFEISEFSKKLAENMDGSLAKLKSENVTYYNSLQVMFCYRQVYSQTNDFGLAKQICEEYPEACRLDRPRWMRAKGDN